MTHDTKKTKKFRFRGLFHPASPQGKEEDTKVSISALKKLDRTKEHEEILKLIERETIPSVRAAWIDYFLENTKRSKCKKSD